MNRRRLLEGAAILGGSMIGAPALATIPCPPGIRTASGTLTVDNCSPAGSLEEDFQRRATAPGVVWFHDFSRDEEVNAFRWMGGYGNDPTDSQKPGRCVRDTQDGITGGGCLSIHRLAGANDESPFWWRPFAPMNGTSNGRGEDDPADNLALKAWDPSNPSENERFLDNYYAHTSYWGEDGHTQSKFAGTEFWLQRRIKFSESHRTCGIEGKLDMILTTQSTLNQEIVNQAQGEVNPSVGPNHQWKRYTNFGQSPPSTGSMKTHGSLQGGSKFADDPDSWWVWPHETWVTQLDRIVPGTHGQPNTILQSWVALPGETNYTTVYDNSLDPNIISFSSPTQHPRGYNAYSATTYHNNQQANNDWYQKYDQIIFSHQFIECPQVY